MKKIISLFKRDYDGTRLVYDVVVPGAEWVVQGEGVATRKWDGTCCMIQNGLLFKRYDRKRDKRTNEYKSAPAGWIPAQNPDPVTGHWPGWMPVGNGPEDRWFREAMNQELPDGTYELCGPKVQGNPEMLDCHVLIPHGNEVLQDAPCSFAELKLWFIGKDIEGIVWHHPDGRRVKIKKKDFGLARSD